MDRVVLNAKSEAQEMVVVTHADVLADTAFQSVAALMTEPYYVATVDHAGGYAFYLCQKTGPRLLGRARMGPPANV